MKRLTAIALSITIGIFMFVGISAAETSSIVGDFNADGKCDIVDALIIIRAVLNGNATDNMEITGDGKVSLLDVLKVLKTAAGSDAEEITEPTFVVGDITASAGDTSVSVPVSVVKNPGILGMTLIVSYDDTVMTLTGSANGDALNMLSFTKPKNYKSGSIFTWYGEALSESEITDGEVLTLTFDISADAPSGTYPVEISYTEGDIFNGDLSPVEIAIRNGSCNIVVSSEGGEGGEAGGNGEGGERDEITEPTFVVSAVNASAGDTSVTVPVSIVKNPGILGMTLIVSYDDTVMTLADSANGDALNMLSFTKPKNYKSGSIFTWYGEVLSESEITDGEVLTLTFDISANAPSGTYPVEISYTEGDIFNGDLSPVEIEIKNGNITIAE